MQPGTPGRAYVIRLRPGRYSGCIQDEDAVLIKNPLRPSLCLALAVGKMFAFLGSLALIARSKHWVGGKLGRRYAA